MGNDNALRPLPRSDGRCPFELSLQQQQGLIRDRAKCFEGLDGFFNKFDVMPQIISEYFTT